MNQEKIYTILKKAIVSEKSTRLTQYNQTYVFSIAVTATKNDVKEAVEKFFSVNVVSVTTVCTKGKTKRFRGRMGSRVNTKKAYVRLEQDQSIDLSNLE